MLIETHSIWSLGAGQYQVWYKIRAEQHKLPGISDLVTPSVYSPFEKPPFRWRYFVGFALDNPSEDLWFLVTTADGIRPVDKPIYAKTSD